MEKLSANSASKALNLPVVLTTRQLNAHFNIKRRKAGVLAASGQIKAYKPGIGDKLGKEWLFLTESVCEYLEHYSNHG